MYSLCLHYKDKRINAVYCETHATHTHTHKEAIFILKVSIRNRVISYIM